MRLRNGKRKGSGAVPGGHSDAEEAASADVLPQPGVGTWIRVVRTVADHRDRRGSAGPQRTGVSSSVDALGETGDDDHAGPSETVTELAGGLPSRSRGVPRADDPDAAVLQRGQVAAGEQDSRRLRIVTEDGRELHVSGR